jgi:hypothetical protein
VRFGNRYFLPLGKTLTLTYCNAVECMYLVVISEVVGLAPVIIYSNRNSPEPLQGCQIFLGTIYKQGRGKIYQMTAKF